MTGALRFDDNSAFGKNFDATAYPKASVSWLLSDEPFFGQGLRQHPPASRRLRRSGQQPGTTDALRFFRPVSGKKDGAASTGVTFGSLGNPDLKPERSASSRSGSTRAVQGPSHPSSSPTTTRSTKDALILRPGRRLGRQRRRASSSTSARSGTRWPSCHQHPDDRRHGTSPGTSP